MVIKESGETDYGFFRVIGGKLMLVVSDADIADYGRDTEETFSPDSRVREHSAV